jgi:hypothetical protein
MIARCGTAFLQRADSDRDPAQQGTNVFVFFSSSVPLAFMTSRRRSSSRERFGQADEAEDGNDAEQLGCGGHNRPKARLENTHICKPVITGSGGMSAECRPHTEAALPRRGPSYDESIVCSVRKRRRSANGRRSQPDGGRRSHNPVHQSASSRSPSSSGDSRRHGSRSAGERQASSR